MFDLTMFLGIFTQLIEALLGLFLSLLGGGI